MYSIAQQMDEFGRPAWFIAMIAGFVAFWPIGLAILAYMIWSGRMGRGCSAERFDRKMQRLQAKMDRWRSASPQGYSRSGNQAFDAYRNETLSRLEQEEAEFHAYLQRLRQARDKAEFDQFMAERNGQTGPATGFGPSA